MHAGGAQEQMLLGRLDPLRRHLHAETAAEADHGMDDGGGIGGLLDRAHETGIDLELVERKTPQIKQTGISSAEIVERKAHADAFELQHRQFGVFQITEERAFGQFKFETVGLETSLGDNALDQLDKIRAAELQRRDIDGDGQRRPIASETGAPEHEFAELDDQPGMLRNWNEPRRRDFTVDGMNPARQRLHAHELLAARIDNWLIDDVQLLVFDRLA